MSESRRIQRVEKELFQLVASFLISGFKEPLPAMVSVSHVMAAKDLRSAKVFVSVMGAETEKRESLKLLQGRSADFQRHIATNLRMKFCPKLTFIIDQGIENRLKVDRLLHEISRDSIEEEG